MQHDPTRQKQGMYHSLNTKDADHGTPHKELNAMGSLVDQRNTTTSNSGFSKSISSPVNVKQIDGFKSWSTNVLDEPNKVPDTLGYKTTDFSTKQIPNTGPTKFRPETDLSVTSRKVQHQSKSMIFHDK